MDRYRHLENGVGTPEMPPLPGSGSAWSISAFLLIPRARPPTTSHHSLPTHALNLCPRQGHIGGITAERYVGQEGSLVKTKQATCHDFYRVKGRQ